MNYKVSIVIPIYNVESYIKESLLSALNQDFESIEYILVDDCGTDNSMQIISDILRTHFRGKDVFIYRHERNKGLSAARNTGLLNSTGTYVFFMDSDDEITIDCICKHYNAIIRNNADFTVANLQLIGLRSSYHIRDIMFDELAGINIIQAFFERKWNVSAWNKLYNREFLRFNSLSFAEGLLHEDILWAYHVAMKANLVVGIHEKTYLYKIRSGSITTGMISSHKIESLLFIVRCIRENLQCGNKQIELNHFIMNYLIVLRFNSALLLLNCQESYEKKKEYYYLINLECHKNRFYGNIYSFLLSLPFWAFAILLKIPYFLYKKMKQ